MRLKKNIEYIPYTSLFNFPSYSDLETINNPLYEKKIETMFDDLIESYRSLYDVDTEDVSKKKERKMVVRGNVNSTIDPRKL